ncbi:hypothetical protein CEXT_772211 [Caerostris extrusa]|uniref:Uncharacterized protein n=1 Tax=Caerostris extrusa TaxID=172846 RepID=A0AAV4WRH2_CAEEX|nr:hypothetical protein CEXT_772211 [Caerostris extrusa]
MCSGTRYSDRDSKARLFPKRHQWYPKIGIPKTKKKICEGKKIPIGPLGTHSREKTKTHLEEKRGKYSFPQCAMYKTITFSKLFRFKCVPEPDTAREIQKHVFSQEASMVSKKIGVPKPNKKKSVKKKIPVGPLGTHSRERTKNHLEEKTWKIFFPSVCRCTRLSRFSKGGTRNKNKI